MKRAVHRSDDWKDKREDVLLAAAALIARRGIEAVSMRDIAQLSDLHVSTLYYYFRNKDELYRAVCDWAFDRISSVTMLALQSEGSNVAKLRRLTEASVTFLLEDVVAARILDQEFIVGNDLWKDARYPDTTRNPTLALAELLTEMQPPLIAHMPALRLAEIFWDISYGIVRFSPGNERVMSGSTRSAHKDAVVDELWLVLSRVLFEGGEPPLEAEAPGAR